MPSSHQEHNIIDSRVQRGFNLKGPAVPAGQTEVETQDIITTMNIREININTNT